MIHIFIKKTKRLSIYLSLTSQQIQRYQEKVQANQKYQKSLEKLKVIVLLKKKKKIKKIINRKKQIKIN